MGPLFEHSAIISDIISRILVRMLLLELMDFTYSILLLDEFYLLMCVTSSKTPSGVYGS